MRYIREMVRVKIGEKEQKMVIKAKSIFSKDFWWSQKDRELFILFLETMLLGLWVGFIGWLGGAW